MDTTGTLLYKDLTASPAQQRMICSKENLTFNFHMQFPLQHAKWLKFLACQKGLSWQLEMLIKSFFKFFVK